MQVAKSNNAIPRFAVVGKAGEHDSRRDEGLFAAAIKNTIWLKRSLNGDVGDARDARFYVSAILVAQKNRIFSESGVKNANQLNK